MRVKIKRLDPSFPLPAYHTAESAAFDIASAEEKTIATRAVTLVRTGLIIEAPHGYFLMLSARSSLARKKGLILANGIGIVDRDYSGPKDEIMLSLYNFTGREVKIEKGERLAQGMFFPIERVEWVEVRELRKNSRGGFGSTG